jgi:hypothetical protein
MDERVANAALLYLMRQLRVLDPSGYFDGAGRWYADKDEELPCCKRHQPSRKHQYRMTKHCRTLGHITDLLGADYASTNRLLRTPEWRVIRKILQVGGQRTGLKRDARPTVQECAPVLLQKAKENAYELTGTELDTFTKWVRAYCPEVDEIDWDAIRAYQALKQQ